MSLYTDEIKRLLDNQIKVVPYSLLVDYLHRNFGLSQYASEEAVYAAARARAVIKDGDYVMRSQFIKPDGMTMANAKAFAVVLEYMPDATNFCVGTVPWRFAFVHNGKLFQVGYIKGGEEFAQSNILALKPVPEEERENYTRILVVEPNVDMSKIRAAGYRFICTVDETDNYNITIIKKVPQEEAWADVPKA
jgi:mRNA-degrading endonuclease RelE of RelBE toxin-antitoxin system